MKLHSHWRSTASYRVRIAMNIKGMSFETIPVSLVKGEQASPSYAALNPAKAVPTLVTDEGLVLTQSLAILDYLEAIAPDPSLLPNDAAMRARVLAAAFVLASDVHPVNNLKVTKRLKAMGHSQDECTEWMRHWMAEGLAAFQAQIEQDTPFCFGDTPTYADICLIPQLYNAHRWGLDLAPFTRLTDIEARCLALVPFDAARPENQPDAG